MTLSPRWWPRAALTLARTYGLRGGVLRARHELRRAIGRFRATPIEARAADTDPPADHPFRVDAERLADATDAAAARERADRVAGGEHQAYRWDWRPLPADAAAWLRHPATGRSREPVPWWRIPLLDPDFGDIKGVWEPARMAWAYDLVRGYLVTGEDRYARAFHDRFESWAASSPPFRGPHWACGQETAIRAAALLYAEANLAGAPASSPAAKDRIAATLAASGERIHDALGYAISQRNNHGISEATGLVLLGIRFRDRHPSAGRWLATGRKWLDRLVREQFAPDGWYIQHSFNYLRLALDQLVLAHRGLATIGVPPSPAVVDRVAAAVDLLAHVMEPGSGAVPNHGANDGAYTHPITLRGYRDHRPTVTAVCATFDLPLPASIEPDPEVLAWLGADAPRPGAAPGDGVRHGPAGWATAKVGPTHVFLRAGSYRTRPGHIDPLHIDVRFGPREAVVDPGTFSYNAPPLDRELPSARAHNGPLVDGTEPGVRGPRFLWLTWPGARIRGVEWAPPDRATLIAEIPGRVRRHITVTRDGVRVADRALDAAASELTVRWLLHPESDAAVTVEPPAAAARETAWFSPRYGQKLEAPAVLARRAVDGTEGELVSRITPHRQEERQG